MPVLTEELAHLRRDPVGSSGHRWQISCLDFSPNGKFLASGSWDKEVRIWDLSSLETVMRLREVHLVPITSVNWHRPSSALLAVGSADCTVSLWDALRGKHLASITSHDGWVLDARFSPDGSNLASASWDKTIRVWDSESQALINSFKGHKMGVWSVDFSPRTKSNLICSGSEDGTILMWDTRTNRIARTFDGGHDGAVYCARWSPDGAMIASGSADAKVCVWEPGSGALINTIDAHLDTVKSVCFNPQTKNTALPLLASAGGLSVQLSDPRPSHRSNILTLTPHAVKKEVECVTISPDGSLIASGGRDGMVVLMTLFVPSVVPRSANNLSHRRGLLKSRKTPKKDTNLGDDGVDADLEELDMILRAPDPLESQHNISRLKRISRTAVKTVELEEYGAAAKKGVIARKSRGKRVEGKVIDIPTMVAHLSATARAYGPEEPSSSDESDVKPGHSRPSRSSRVQPGEGIVSRIRRLASPRWNEPSKPPRKTSSAGDIGKLKKQFTMHQQLQTAQKQGGSEDDPEVQFLMGSSYHPALQRSPTVDSLGISTDQYNMLSSDQFDSSIVFSDSMSQRLSSPTHSESFSDNSLPTSPVKGVLSKDVTHMAEIEEESSISNSDEADEVLDDDDEVSDPDDAIVSMI